jgi:pimeloyl-ACP methyl ester carboxylesterase
MDDLAEVLRALGYDQVNLYGGSYGATAVQYFLAQHPDLARTAILDGGTLLDVPLFELWGRNGHRAMQRILGRCAASGRCARAYPRVRRELFEVLAGVRRAPVRVDGATVDAAAAAETFQWLSRSPEGAAQIPWIAHRARLGDWTPFALARDAQAAAAGPDVQRLLMTWSIRCNEPWARMSPARTAAASSGTYLAEWTARTAGLTATVCSVFPRVRQPGWARTGIRSEAPVLVVAGGADPQDPPANMAGAGRQLANSRTVVVPAAGHGAVHLGCVPRVARSFVERGTTVGLDTRCAAAWRPPPFVAPG